MNTIDHYLLKTASLEEKVAFDQTLRNAGVDILRGGGRVLRSFDDSPMLSSAVLGAGVGGIHGAMTADPMESRSGKAKKALRNALAGAVAGGATGGIFSGAAKNIGRYGRDIEDAAIAVRGKSGLKDVKANEFADIMRGTVFNSDSFRGGKALKPLRDNLDAAMAKLKVDETQANVDAVMNARKALNQAGGRYGSRFNPLEAAGMIGGAGLAGSMANNYREKTSSLRIREVLDKQANFGALAAKALGYGAQGAGKVIQMGAANPALAGAAVGAAGGAIAGGEGNRLKGALGGAALGAGAGAGLAKLAPQATANMGQFGKSLSTTGKLNVRAANKNLAAIKGGADPSTLKALPGYGNMGNVNANFAKANRGQFSDLATKKTQQIGYGMSGGAAAGTALAGVGAAGLAGGAAAGALGADTPENRARAAAARQRFSNVAMT